MLDIIPEALFIFSYFFFRFFRLDIFCWPIFKFTDYFFCVLILNFSFQILNFLILDFHLFFPYLVFFFHSDSTFVHMTVFSNKSSKIVKVAALKLLSINSNIWVILGSVFVVFLFLMMGHIFMFLHMSSNFFTHIKDIVDNAL